MECSVTDLGRSMRLFCRMLIGPVISGLLFFYPLVTLIRQFLMKLRLGLDVSDRIVTHLQVVTVLMSLSGSPATFRIFKLVKVVIVKALAGLSTKE